MDGSISQFAAITGASADKAKFYVEAANGDVQAALSSFYEAEGTGDESTAAPNEEEAAPADYTGPRTLSGAPAPSLPEGWGNTGSSSASRSTGSSGAARSGGIATFSSLRGESGTSGRSRGGGAFRGGIGRINQGDDEDDDDDGPPNLFTGGERSGLSVQDPEAERRRRMLQALAAGGGPGGAGGDLVQNILRQAAEGGPPPPPLGGGAAGAGAAAGSVQAFGGRGRTIGDDDQPEPEPASAASQGRSMPGSLAGDDPYAALEDGSHLPPAVRHLIFWQDGFTIGESRLYRYDDPQDQAILQAIQSQRAPLSLLNVRPGQEVELRVEKKLDEKYKPPAAPPVQPFGGSGNRLSSPVPAALSSSTATPAPSTVAPASQVEFELDSTKPVTQIQLRLADGSKLVGKFNHDHTVADIRSYINASQPGASARAYTLQASFPPKPITDENQSIKDAGLLNAVVIQKYT